MLDKKSVFIGAACWRLLACACLLLGFGQAGAQVSVSGDIQSAAHWTVDGGPYIVSGDVAIRNAARLTIDPGVAVFMSRGASLTVEDGSIQARGTAQDPIRVRSDASRQTPAQAAPGDWKQWIFTAGTLDTQLDHVEFEHGSGLVVRGSAPVLNHLNLRNHHGPAITLDLDASPVGVGLQASGNTVNGIAVAAGEIGASVRWGLRGIPYVVAGGTVSVGRAPRVDSMAPTTLEQGQTVTLVLAGSRLSGAGQPVFDRAGLSATLFPGGSDTQATLQVTALPSTPAGLARLRLLTDAGEVAVDHALAVTVPLPAISALAPAFVLAGDDAQEIQVTGRNFAEASQVLFNEASVPTQFVSAGELRASLPRQTATGTLRVQVRTPDAPSPGQALLSAAMDLPVRAPVPPVVSVEPTPIALPPDGRPRQITIRLSKADYRDHALQLAIADPARASVSPASLTLAAGQTQAVVTVTPLAAGTTSLSIGAPALAAVRIPLFITQDFRGVNTAFSAPVGVLTPAAILPQTRTMALAQPLVGVSVGAVLTQASPAAWRVGSEVALTVQGHGIPPGARLSLQPDTGLSIGTPTVDADGTRLGAAIQTAADAPAGYRRVVVTDAQGRELVFADPAQSVVNVVGGLPLLASIDPFAAVRGTTVDLVVRGRHLHRGRVAVLPDSGITVDAVPQISEDGTRLTVRLAIAGDAPLGARVVRVDTPAGASSAVAASANTLQIVSALHAAPQAVTSPVVGVRRQEQAEGRTLPLTPVSTAVGVLAGAGVVDVSPRVGVVGGEVEVTVRGTGLHGLDAVGFDPAPGLEVVAAPRVDAQGTQARFTVRVAADAALGVRRLVLRAQGRELAMLRPQLQSFLVSAPVPDLASVSPQVVVAGQPAVALTLRGRDLAHATGVRIEPAEGLTLGPPTVLAGQDALHLTLQAAEGAVPGPRTVIVSSAAGASSAVPALGNTLHIATRAGPAYADLSAPAVGVVRAEPVGTGTRIDLALLSPAVGVRIEQPAVAGSASLSAAAAPVGVLAGAAGVSLSPRGWLRGASGHLVVKGQGLAAVEAASAMPDAGVLLGAVSANAEGTELRVPIAIAPDAPVGGRALRLHLGTSGVLAFAGAAGDRFAVGQMPQPGSVAPIVLERGKPVTLTVRGSQLAGVTGVAFVPDQGLATHGAPQWGEDSLGEYLRINVLPAADAPLGARVLQLQVPGGTTPADPRPSNTVTVVVPQQAAP